eukprot:TRINITY_DN41760_c0_g1_i1.p1 TRINITY_DN41760_c0_g1~~TRINITY_DN41760_c0_g1_i1.p1  ORF type:complete len:150 (-),score=13.63 TRINITY_DN41760_c0_g1_i1:822-1271(-)
MLVLSCFERALASSQVLISQRELSVATLSSYWITCKPIPRSLSASLKCKCNASVTVAQSFCTESGQRCRNWFPAHPLLNCCASLVPGFCSTESPRRSGKKKIAIRATSQVRVTQLAKLVSSECNFVYRILTSLQLPIAFQQHVRKEVAP